MDSRTKQDFTRRITQSNRSELVVVLYDICFSYLDEAEKNLKEKDFDVYKEASDWRTSGGIEFSI